jgi:hypothetical protein
MCAKTGSDRFKNVKLYKVETKKQTFSLIFKMMDLPCIFDTLCWGGEY